MNSPDLSTKLKFVALVDTLLVTNLNVLYRLMGVDVASFGDFFADQRLSTSRPTKIEPPAGSKTDKGQAVLQISIEDPSLQTTKSGTVGKRGRKQDEPIKCLVYKDPFSATYKKYIFTADGKHLLGGMMIGDVADYVKLVALVKKKVILFLFLYVSVSLMLLLRNRWRFLLPNLSSGRRTKALTTEMTLMMTLKFVAAT
jgi:nitrite reductase (NAD(P)H)